MTSRDPSERIHSEGTSFLVEELDGTRVLKGFSWYELAQHEARPEWEGKEDVIVAYAKCFLAMFDEADAVAAHAQADRDMVALLASHGLTTEDKVAS